MGILNFLKKSEKQPTMNVKACTSGKLIDITTVPDPIFANKMIGNGYAIEPSDGKICSPIDGVIVALFPTGHAFGVRRSDGLEMLVHIGIDTVSVDSNCFKKLVKQGDTIFAGDPCIKADLYALREDGYTTTVMNVFTKGFTESLDNLEYNKKVKTSDIILENVKAIIDE